MKFVHQREHLNEDDMVVIECSQRCNIRLMSDANYRAFKNGARHTYHGGEFDRFPARITIPSTGYWNITLDTAGSKLNNAAKKAPFKHAIKLIRRSPSSFS